MNADSVGPKVEGGSGDLARRGRGGLDLVDKRKGGLGCEHRQCSQWLPVLQPLKGTVLERLFPQLLRIGVIFLKTTCL